MTAPLPASRISRVVIAIDSTTPSLLALETGVGLAGAVGASLEGLYFEDIDLLRLGALPFAVEFSALTGMRRELSSRHIERALRLEAARQEQLLAASAARTRVPWSFAVARGQRLTAAVAREAELVVLAPRARGPGGLARPGPPGPIAAMFDASDAAARALSAVARLAATLAREMLILVPDGESRPAQARREQAQAWLAAERLSGRVVALLPELAALVAVVRTQRSAILALPASALTAWPMEMDALLAGLICPLVLAR
jgi:hypothetical protein